VSESFFDNPGKSEQPAITDTSRRAAKKRNKDLWFIWFLSRLEILWRELQKNILSFDFLEKPLKSRWNPNPGQTERDPKSRVFKQIWIPDLAGMAKRLTSAKVLFYNVFFEKATPGA